MPDHPPQLPATPDAWLRPQPGCGECAVLRVLCFPPAGGGAASFEALHQAAGPQIECVTVDLPGHMPRLAEPPVLTPEPLLSELTHAVAAAVAADGLPYVLLGHCMGAILAFEVTARLEALGARRPLRLIAAGSNPPQCGVEPVADPVGFLRAMGGPDELFELPALLELTVGILRNDLELMRAYRYAGGVIGTPATVLYGAADRSVDRDAMSGWKALCRGGVSLRELPGGHVFLDRHYPELLRELHAELGGV
ncbi:thioesterase II family protein [Spongiactinospora sp. 9N601]|uniref:thioesterase II family protein n=1 Tax=Spongiactinospora sp. 9N601 TaxID=3375149 RepID=UPI00379057F5